MLFFFTLVFRVYSWNFKIHRTTFIIATKDLPSSVKEDIASRLELFENKKWNAQELAILPDMFRSNYGFLWLKEMHYNHELYGSENKGKTPDIVRALDHLTHYLIGRNSEVYFLDTLALVWFAHLVGDVFQPFHCFPGGGLKIKKKGYLNLHDFWDQGCGFLTSLDEKAFASLLITFFEERKSVEIKGIRFSPNNKTLNTDQRYLAIFKEGLTLGKKFEEVSMSDYDRKCFETVMERVYLSGKKMGDVLTKFYKTNKYGKSLSKFKKKSLGVSVGYFFKVFFIVLLIQISGFAIYLLIKFFIRKKVKS